jgi:hypothetical protein
VNGSPMVGLWFVLWVAALVAGWIAEVSIGYPRTWVAQPYRSYAIANSIGLVPGLAAGVLIIVIMRRIIRWQQAMR